MGVSLRAMVTTVTSIGAFSAGLFSALPQAARTKTRDTAQVCASMRSGGRRTISERIGEPPAKGDSGLAPGRQDGDFYSSRGDLSTAQRNAERDAAPRHVARLTVAPT